jgi:serine/threonine protein kinase
MEPGRAERTLKPTVPSEQGPGTIIGRYKLLEKIGEGGFGTVYVAEQREPVKRRVALKLLRRGLDTRQVLARFEMERQALALMDHPPVCSYGSWAQTLSLSRRASLISRSRVGALRT